MPIDQPGEGEGTRSAEERQEILRGSSRNPLSHRGDETRVIIGELLNKKGTESHSPEE